MCLLKSVIFAKPNEETQDADQQIRLLWVGYLGAGQYCGG